MKKCFLRVAVEFQNDIEHLEIELKENKEEESHDMQNKTVEALVNCGIKIVTVEYIEKFL